MHGINIIKKLSECVTKKKLSEYYYLLCTKRLKKKDNRKMKLNYLIEKIRRPSRKIPLKKLAVFK